MIIGLSILYLVILAFWCVKKPWENALSAVLFCVYVFTPPILMSFFSANAVIAKLLELCIWLLLAISIIFLLRSSKITVSRFGLVRFESREEEKWQEQAKIAKFLFPVILLLGVILAWLTDKL